MNDTTITGAAPRPAFEDLEVGFELPSLERGPLSTAHLMRWSAATENWHRIHYDYPYATKVEGLPDLLVSGNWKQQFLTELISSWLEPDGWLISISFQFRAMNVRGQTLSAWARITDLSTWNGYGIVRLELGITNEYREESTPGLAVGIVPLAGGETVPYPFTLEWTE